LTNENIGLDWQEGGTLQIDEQFITSLLPFSILAKGAMAGMCVYSVLFRIGLEVLMFPAFFVFLLLFPVFDNLPSSEFTMFFVINVLGHSISSLSFAILGALLTSKEALPKHVGRISLAVSVFLNIIPGLCALIWWLMLSTLPFGIEGSGLSSDEAKHMAPLAFCGGAILLTIPIAVRHIVRRRTLR
jgi:hypothetical protein